MVTCAHEYRQDKETLACNLPRILPAQYELLHQLVGAVCDAASGTTPAAAVAATLGGPGGVGPSGLPSTDSMRALISAYTIAEARAVRCHFSHSYSQAVLGVCGVFAVAEGCLHLYTEYCANHSAALSV